MHRLFVSIHMDVYIYVCIWTFVLLSGFIEDLHTSTLCGHWIPFRRPGMNHE